VTTDQEFPLEFSNTIGALAGALSAAQGELEDAKKDGTNPHFGNRYSTLASVRAAITPTFSKHGLAVTQYFVPHGPDGVLIVALLMHKSGEWIRSRLYLPAVKKDPQGFGSAISYGRRYQLQAIANIASDDDDDGEAASATPSAKAAPKDQPKPASSVDVEKLVKALSESKTAEALAEASLAVSRNKDKLSKKDIERCRNAHDAALRAMEKAA
jgi:hypothetical protein